MLTTLRRRLRRIRYYSANRPTTGWSRAVDVGAVAALVLAFPATWLSARLVHRTDTVEYVGQLSRREDGRLIASTVAADAPLSWGPGAWGEFAIRMDEIAEGWPLTVQRAWPPARTALKVFATDQNARPIDPVADREASDAVADSLHREGFDDVVEAMTRDRPIVQPMILNWVIAGLLWWTMLFLVLTVLVEVLRRLAGAGRVVRDARRTARRRAGRCPSCGYDTRGSVYSERCPECGSLLD